jgi:glycosyltransferase involved in cell wall biosynthesis
MNILYITESFGEKKGGTIFYSEKIVRLMSKHNKCFLIFPSEKNEIIVEGNTTYISIKMSKGQNFRKMQIEFSKYLNFNLTDLLKKYKIDVIHILAGFIISDKIKILDVYGVKSPLSVITIHNIPPRECSKSWLGDDFKFYFIDQFRKFTLYILSTIKIAKLKYDIYIVPCLHIKNDFLKYPNTKKKRVEVLRHGTNQNFEHYTLKDDHGKISILTVGGLVPHKNQHKIIDACVLLKKNGVLFEWLIIGPIRNKRFHAYLLHKVFENKLEDSVKIICNATDEDLKLAYKSSNIYVQPSSEEGFCLTALDAAAYGLPVVGTDVGELKSISDLTNGICLKSTKSEEIYNSIINLLPKINDGNIDQNIIQTRIQNKYNWNSIAEELQSLYETYTP